MKLIPRLSKADTSEAYSRRQEKWRSIVASDVFMKRHEALRKKSFFADAVTLIIVTFTLFSSPVPEIQAFLACAGLFCYFAFHIRYRLKAGEKFGILTFIAPFILCFALLVDCIFSSTVDETMQLVFYIAETVLDFLLPCLLPLLFAFFMLVRPFIVLLQLMVRRMRCSYKTSAKYLEYSEIDSRIPKDYITGSGGYPQYTYEYMGMDFVFSYKKVKSIISSRPSSISLRIDPDYPHYFYDRNRAALTALLNVILLLAGIRILLMNYSSIQQLTEILRELITIYGGQAHEAVSGTPDL